MVEPTIATSRKTDTNEKEDQTWKQKAGDSEMKTDHGRDIWKQNDDFNILMIVIIFWINVAKLDW